jgi:hypothetical protein
VPREMPAKRLVRLAVDHRKDVVLRSERLPDANRGRIFLFRSLRLFLKCLVRALLWKAHVRFDASCVETRHFVGRYSVVRIAKPRNRQLGCKLDQISTPLRQSFKVPLSSYWRVEDQLVCVNAGLRRKIPIQMQQQQRLKE